MGCQHNGLAWGVQLPGLQRGRRLPPLQQRTGDMQHAEAHSRKRARGAVRQIKPAAHGAHGQRRALRAAGRERARQPGAGEGHARQQRMRHHLARVNAHLRSTHTCIVF